MRLGFRQCYLPQIKASHCEGYVHVSGYAHVGDVNDCVRGHEHGRDYDCTFLGRLILSINFCLRRFMSFFVREVLPFIVILCFIVRVFSFVISVEHFPVGKFMLMVPFFKDI